MRSVVVVAGVSEEELCKCTCMMFWFGMEHNKASDPTGLASVSQTSAA